MASPVFYDQAVAATRDLIEVDSETGTTENKEYARGAIELIAMLWPTGYIDADKNRIANDLGLDPSEVF